MQKRQRVEKVFVQVSSPDGSVEYHEATQHVGRQMPFTNPKATCGMRVSDSAVAFSLLHLTKQTAKVIADKELTMPRGPLARLERRAEEVAAQLTDGHILIETDEHTQMCTISRDENGVATLDPVGDDITFTLPKAAVKCSLYLAAPALGRVIAIGFIGHPGKPGSPTTLRRVASNALFALAQLAPFRVLTDIETVIVPSNPRTMPAPVRRADDQVGLAVPVWLFSDQQAPVGHGHVGVQVDLESSNPAGKRLLFHYTPSEEIAELFPHYRDILDSTIASELRRIIGDDDIKAIAVSIVLGDVATGMIERLREALAPFANGLDLTPRMYQYHQH